MGAGLMTAGRLLASSEGRELFESVLQKTPAPLRPLVKAIGERLTGSKPGVLRAVLAAIIVGVAAAVLTYWLLRHS